MLKWIVGFLALAFVVVLFTVLVYKPSPDSGPSGSAKAYENTTMTDVYDPYTWALDHKARK